MKKNLTMDGEKSGTLKPRNLNSAQWISAGRRNSSRCGIRKCSVKRCSARKCNAKKCNDAKPSNAIVNAK